MCDVSFLPRPCAVSVTTGHVQLFPYHIDHLLYSTLAMNMGCASYPVHSTNGTIVWSQDEVGAAVSPVPDTSHSGACCCIVVWCGEM